MLALQSALEMAPQTMGTEGDEFCHYDLGAVLRLAALMGPDLTRRVPRSGGLALNPAYSISRRAASTARSDDPMAQS